MLKKNIMNQYQQGQLFQALQSLTQQEQAQAMQFLMQQESAGSVIDRLNSMMPSQRNLALQTNNRTTIKNAKNIDIIARIPANQSVITLDDQPDLRNKKIISIFQSGEAKDYNGNDTLNTGYFLQLSAGNFIIAIVPSTQLDFDANTSLEWDKINITWQKCKILTSETSVSDRYIHLIVYYEEFFLNEQ